MYALRCMTVAYWMSLNDSTTKMPGYGKDRSLTRRGYGLNVDFTHLNDV